MNTVNHKANYNTISDVRNQSDRFNDAIDALRVIDPSDTHDWLVCGAALFTEFGHNAKSDWVNWSLTAGNACTESELHKNWVRFSKKTNHTATIASLFYLARQQGWTPPVGSGYKPPKTAVVPKQRKQTVTVATDVKVTIQRVLDASTQANSQHPYLARKHCEPTNLLQIPLFELRRIIGYTPAQTGKDYKTLTSPVLVAPVTNIATGDITGIDFIGANGAKCAMQYSNKVGGAFLLQPLPEDERFSGEFYYGEGVATCDIIKKSTNQITIATLSIGNAASIIESVRDKYPLANHIYCCDNKKGAIEPLLPKLQANWLQICHPKSLPINAGTDFNDLYHHAGMGDVGSDITKKFIPALKPIIVKPSQASQELKTLNGTVDITGIDESLLKRIAYAKNVTLALVQLGRDGIDTDTISKLKHWSLLLSAARNEINRVLHRVPYISSLDDVVADVLCLISECDGFTRNLITGYANYQYEKRRANVTEWRSFNADFTVGTIDAAYDIIKNGIGVFAVRAPHGTGKTYHLIRPMFNAAENAGYIAHLQSLVSGAVSTLNSDTLKSVFELTSKHECIDYRNTDTPVPKIASCVPSILNDAIEKSFSSAKFLAIDEIAHVLATVIGRNKIVDKRGKKIFQKLIDFIISADTTVVCDADLSDFEIDILRGALPELKITTIDVVPDVTRKMQTVVHASRGAIFNKILDDLMNGRRVIVACTSAKAALQLERYISVSLPSISGLCIQKRSGFETAGNWDVSEFLKSPDTECEKYQYLIYSPAIESGVSFNNGYWDTHYGIYDGGIIPADFIQMIMRDRQAESFEIAISGTGKRPVKNTAANTIADWTYSTRLISILNGSQSELTPYDVQLVMMNGRHNSMRECYGQNLCLLLENDGRFEVTYVATKDGKIFNSVLSEINQDLDDNLVEKINAAQRINRSEYLELQYANTLSTHESVQKLGYEIRNTMRCDDVTLQDYQLFGDGAINSQIKNFQLLTGMSAADTEVDNSDAVAGVNVTSRSNRAMRAAAVASINAAFKSSGVDILNGQGFVTTDVAAEVFTRLESSPTASAVQLTMGAPLARRPSRAGSVRWANNLLTRFGLWLERISSNSEHHYIIAQDVKYSSNGAAKVPGLSVMTTLFQFTQQSTFGLNTSNPKWTESKKEHSNSNLNPIPLIITPATVTTERVAAVTAAVNPSVTAAVNPSVTAAVNPSVTAAPTPLVTTGFGCVHDWQWIRSLGLWSIAEAVRIKAWCLAVECPDDEIHDCLTKPGLGRWVLDRAPPLPPSDDWVASTPAPQPLPPQLEYAPRNEPVTTTKRKSGLSLVGLSDSERRNLIELLCNPSLAKPMPEPSWSFGDY